jgi:hypothetical protein
MIAQLQRWLGLDGDDVIDALITEKGVSAFKYATFDPRLREHAADRREHAARARRRAGQIESGGTVSNLARIR